MRKAHRLTENKKYRVALPFQDSDQIQTKQSTQQISGERNRHNSARRLGFSEAMSSSNGQMRKRPKDKA